MLLLCAVAGAEDLLGTLRERLREKYSNASDEDDEMRAFYESCEAVTTTLVCDWIRNEAENGDLSNAVRAFDRSQIKDQRSVVSLSEYLDNFFRESPYQYT